MQPPQYFHKTLLLHITGYTTRKPEIRDLLTQANDVVHWPHHLFEAHVREGGGEEGD
jgi:hypothetical protein